MHASTRCKLLVKKATVVVTSASLLVTSALLVVTRSYRISPSIFHALDQSCVLRIVCPDKSVLQACGGLITKWQTVLSAWGWVLQTHGLLVESSE